MDAAAALGAAGWQGGRDIDPSRDIEALQMAGFEVGQAAQTFLRAFSGLSIYQPGNPNPLVIDGVVTARHADPGWSAAYSRAVEQPLVPVGEYLYLTFWIAADGTIWATYEEEYGQAGSTLSEVVQALFFESPGLQLDRVVEE